MAINPLDWPPGMFLGYYGSFALAVLVAVVLLRDAIGATRPGGSYEDLGLLELAYLSGGLGRAADTILVSFLAAGAAALDVQKRHIVVDASAADLPKAVEPFRATVNGFTTRTLFHDAIAGDLDAVRQALARRGLAPRLDEIRRLQLLTVILLGFVIAAGLVRVFVGVSRQRPVGFLLAMLAIVALLGVWSVARPPFRTRAGAEAAADGYTRHARVARAPMQRELALAFALSGPSVLAGTPFAGLARQISKDSGGGSCGGAAGCGGGGGGCGGGCGG
jgi:uncharacterized protein (TIGR04222 family)